MTNEADAPTVLDYPRLQRELPEWQRQFAEAQPFRHVVIEDFLRPESAETLLAEFPPLGESGNWINWTHWNEHKFGQNDPSKFSPGISRVVQELNSERFVALLSELSGLDTLLSDPDLEGGGLHQSPRGGFLNVHADFTVHPHHSKWRRRLNLLVYLNPNWLDEYGGHLELWDRDMMTCVQSIAPRFNRAVIFFTDEHSFHGHPEPMSCPDGVTRKSLALYYFTEEEDPLIRATNYRARPGDGIKGVFIWLDKIALRFYHFAKRILGLDDRVVSKILNVLFGSRKKK